ncbi:MAG TPA: DUF4266 domain-containing protein, partial [Polyangiales bacterium]|nr:DUF4266 domain-containing protein [Polyangiales bacterium]
FFRRARGSLIAIALPLMAAGCAPVHPEEKEYLAEPAMTWGAESIPEQHERHVEENREGSVGGSNTTGGGCGCN